MNNAWKVEFTRILVLIALVIIIGLISDAWLWAILLAGATYISWTLVQIRAFERWIRLGAKTHLAPDASGIWQLIVQHIHRTQKKNTHHKKRLSRLAKRFEATISALPDAAIVLNANLEIEWSNQAAFELLGIDEKKDVDQRLDNLIRNPLIQGLLEQNNQVDTQNVEMDSPTDPTKILVLSCIDFGESQKLITARDISQRIAVQKMRKAFVANASHELRTPLTVVSGYLEMLENDSNVPESIKRQLHNASSQAGRMQNILDDLLTLSKLEEKSHTKSAGEQVDIPGLLNKLVNDFRKTKAKNHEIEIDINENSFLKSIESDIYSLCQNLLSNAVKYSPENSLIQVKWENNGDGYVCLRVQDKGEGIAPENLSRLTERFYRVNVTRSKQVGGTGLGLSIVKHILENHGGYLGIESELGRGSTFSACFPLYRVISPLNQGKKV